MIAWFAFRVVLDARANGVRALAGGHCAPHLVHSGAMLYMFLAMTGAGSGMAGMAGMSAGSTSSMPHGSDPTLAFAFALVLIGYSIWDLDQLSGRRYSLGSARVSLAGVRAGVPAMAGAGSAAFSGRCPSGAAPDPITGAAGSGAVGGHAVSATPARGVTSLAAPAGSPPLARRHGRLSDYHGRRYGVYATDRDMKLVGFLILLAVIFVAAHSIGAASAR